MLKSKCAASARAGKSSFCNHLDKEWFLQESLMAGDFVFCFLFRNNFPFLYLQCVLTHMKAEQDLHIKRMVGLEIYKISNLVPQILPS